MPRTTNHEPPAPHILIFSPVKRLERDRRAHGSASNNSAASFLHFPCLLPVCVPNKTCSHVFASFSFSFCHYWSFFFLLSSCLLDPSFMSRTKPAPPLLPPLARILISALAASHTMQLEIIPIIRIIMLLVRIIMMMNRMKTMNVSTNWVFQLLIVEPFNILFHIRENKEFEI